MTKNSVLERLKKDWPRIKFRVGRKFAFRPPRTVVYEEEFEQNCRTAAGGGGRFGVETGGENDVLTEVEVEYNFYNLQLLHEVGHALLEHKDFGADLERVKMERAAWEKARELCERYGVRYDEEFAEGALDSYRDWLHRKSVCPECGATRYQGADGRYRCPGCEEFVMN